MIEQLYRVGDSGPWKIVVIKYEYEQPIGVSLDDVLSISQDGVEHQKCLICEYEAMPNCVRCQYVRFDKNDDNT